VKEALFWRPLKDGSVQCLLCPKVCRIEEGRRGDCGARANQNAVLVPLSYGRITSAAIDPIEKKPLYHFHPAQEILSIGSFGCSFHCLFCQNYGISQGQPPTQGATPADIVNLAKRYRSFAIAYTYNEPLIWFEFVLETAKAARDAGIKNVLVTNGFINRKPLQQLLPFIDAANVDIKSINDDFYRRLCDGRLAPVLRNCVLMRQAGVHLEVTNLVIPGENDRDSDFRALRDWIVSNLGEDVPVHLSAYFPHYRFNAPPTPYETLKRGYDIMREKLRFVYLGNVWGQTEGHDTHCYRCGALLVSRRGYATSIHALTDDGRCKKCGAFNNFVMK